MQKASLLLLIVLIYLSGCKTAQQSREPVSIGQLRLLDVYDIPNNLQYKQTTVGGLSGIDYDSSTDRYYMICDDRSSINPARYYTATIPLRNLKIDTVIFTDVQFLRDGNDQLYPDSKTNPRLTPDPEALRFSPKNGNMIWSSEGERIIRPGDTILTNPSITVINPSGKWISNFSLPGNLTMSALQKGPRQNGVLEGMSFANGYKTLYVNLEEPLYEDGPKAETSPNKAYIRIYRFDVKTQKNTSQFAYELDPVAHAPIPATAFKVNGIPDMLDLGNNRLLVLERSFSTGRLACTIKIFEANLNGATDVSGNGSLSVNTGFMLVKKRLLLNMDDLGIFTDNIEGVSFGPKLPNGNRSLLLVADNNFAAFQRSQVFLLEILP